MCGRFSGQRGELNNRNFSSEGLQILGVPGVGANCRGPQPVALSWSGDGVSGSLGPRPVDSYTYIGRCSKVTYPCRISIQTGVCAKHNRPGRVVDVGDQDRAGHSAFVPDGFEFQYWHPHDATPQSSVGE